MEFKPGARKRILQTYLDLHKDKVGEHWLWVAIERVAAGEPESEVMRDYGYTNSSLSYKLWRAKALLG